MAAEQVRGLALEFPAAPYAVMSAVEAAELLRVELLWEHGIAADVHSGYGMAAVSVWRGLVVWANGRWLRWSPGRISAGGRPLCAVMPLAEVATAARRIARRHAEWRKADPEIWPDWSPNDLR